MRYYGVQNGKTFALGVLLIGAAFVPQCVRAQAALEGEEVLRETVHHQEDALIGKLAEAAENLASSAEAAMGNEIRRDLHSDSVQPLSRPKDMKNNPTSAPPLSPQDTSQDAQDPLVRIEEELQELPE